MAGVSNHFFKLSGILTLLFLLLFSPPIAEAMSTSSEAIGEVVYMAGTVHAQQTNESARELELDSPVFVGDVITTARHSQVEILFTDGTILAQSNDATISLDEFVYSTGNSASKLLFKMAVGTFRVVTGELVKLNPEGFQMSTPLAFLGIRGTQPFFKILSAKDGGTETIGLIELTPGFTVSVTTARQTVTFDRAGLFTNVERDGSMSEAAPTPPGVQRSIQRAAPITSMGELGARGSKEDQKRKVKVFEQHISRQKKDLGDHEGHPDYGKIHHITVQKKALKNAKAQKEGSSKAISDGPTHPDDGHPDGGHPDDGHGDDHGDDHGDSGGGH